MSNGSSRVLSVRRLVCVVAFVAVCTYLAGCADGEQLNVSEQVTEPPTKAPVVLEVDREVPRMLELADRAVLHRQNVDAWVWVAAVNENAETAARSMRRASGSGADGPDQQLASPVSAPSGEGQCGGVYPPCSVRDRESGGNYSAVNPSGRYRGAWQFSQSTWDNTAARAGRTDLVGVLPDQASVADQDEMARVLWSGGAGCAAWSGPSGNAC